MKKLLALASALLLLFSVGCEKSATDYINHISSFIEEKVVTAVENSEISLSNIARIQPENENESDGYLSAYDRLDYYQKKLYSIIRKAVESMELRLIDITGYSSNDIFSDAITAHRALMCDRPDIFWMPKTLSLVSVSGKKNKYICFKDYYAEDDGIGFYGITGQQRDVMLSELKTVRNMVFEKTDQLETAFEKELYFHDYICEHTVYDSASANDLNNADANSMSAYGALVNGTAICEGYSRAMQYLCMESGIPCNLVYGESDGTPHMWNIIDPGDGIYYLDTTFDDSSDSSVLHSYFNLTKAEISDDHIFSEGFLSTKTYDVSDSFNFFTDDCNNTALNYYEKTGAYITEDCQSAIDHLLYQSSAGKSHAELKNLTSQTGAQAIKLLRESLSGILRLKECYEYSGKPIIIVTW